MAKTLNIKELYKWLLFLGIVATVFFVSSSAMAVELCDTCPATHNALKSNCEVCDFVKILLNAINNIVTTCFEHLKGASLPLLGVGLGLWWAWHIGAFFINYKYQDPMEFYTEMGKGGFRAIIISAFLVIPTSEIFDTFISPVVSGFTELSIGLMEDNGSSSGLSQDSSSLTSYLDRDIGGYCKAFLESKSGEMSYESTGKAISPQIMNAVLCMVQEIYDQTAEGMAIGYGMYCQSLGKGWSFFGYNFPDVGMLVIGALVIFVFVLITMAVSFRFIDFIVRLGFVFMLMPPLMVAWVFPSTRQFTKKAWDLFLNCMLMLVCLVIAMALCVELVVAALTKNGGNGTLSDYCNTDNVLAIYNIIYLNGLDWVLFLAIGILALLLIGKTQALANHFVGIDSSLGSTNIGASIGGRMAAVAASVVQAAVTVATVAVTVGVTVATGGVGGVAAGAFQAVKTGAKMAAKEGVKATAKAAAKAAKAKASQAAKNAPRKFAGAVKNKVTDKVNDIKNIPSNIKQNFKDIPNNIRDRIDSFGPQNIKDNILDIKDNIKNNIKEKIKRAPSSVLDEVKEEGKKTEEENS